MTAVLLSTKRVAKPWGRHSLWPGFGDPAPGEEPIGEIWFPSPPGNDPDLLIKYLFTSDRLSVQVHPDDEAARARGHARGKDEAWLVLAAEPESKIALGPKHPLSAGQLRTAALDGSIVDLLDWRPVKAGDFIYSPAGTIHAIGAGLTVIEVQQNLDLTYRLYDYGRPRALHLDEGIAVSTLTPFNSPPQPARPDLLASGPKFTVERLEAGARTVDLGDATGWLVPVTGNGRIDDQPFEAGQCWSVTGRADIRLDLRAAALLAYSGPARA
ncbi:putative mannose-6-phosphate isomerase [Sphingomonas changbaiensis NBRC 104936]|uniref:Putative mannose-6-phosphate isomerase n=1 Tax=Sphingomonas changbaiensis NBRC 104936 TaxID=1219043 RepID=A0A0E9MNF3_9SPHN|nr:class I mannose-6-phosphate isomerase [Sphingomonas changbaiensis]GAO39028.1 putative mannose-6-phosphate isomerase [Sphingomonas changbaiensis NBRC 104936]